MGQFGASARCSELALLLLICSGCTEGTDELPRADPDGGSTSSEPDARTDAGLSETAADAGSVSGVWVRGRVTRHLVHELGVDDVPADLSTTRFTLHGSHNSHGSHGPFASAMGTKQGTFAVGPVPPAERYVVERRLEDDFFLPEVYVIDTPELVIDESGFGHRTDIWTGVQTPIELDLKGLATPQPSDEIRFDTSVGFSGHRTLGVDPFHTSARVPFTWHGPVLDWRAGDRAFVAQYRFGEEAGACSRIVRAAELPPFPMQPGRPAHAAVALEALTSTLAVALSISREVRSQALPAEPLFYGPGLWVTAFTGNGLIARSGRMRVDHSARLGSCPLGDVEADAVDLAFGDPYPHAWDRVLQLGYTFAFAWQRDTSFLGIGYGWRWELPADASVDLRPTLGLMGPPQVDGQSSVPRVELSRPTPRISWAPPSFGRVDLYALVVWFGHKSVWIGDTQFYTPDPFFDVPAGVLEPGVTYLIEVHAIQQDGLRPSRPKWVQRPRSTMSLPTPMFRYVP
ncbi:MAG: hypothetical protein IT384_28550 [Deltaproteobacteria bacterium]|nr:hypothetical protein [Deltaproteobacteria bacterium]